MPGLKPLPPGFTFRRDNCGYILSKDGLGYAIITKPQDPRFAAGLEFAIKYLEEKTNERHRPANPAPGSPAAAQYAAGNAGRTPPSNPSWTSAVNAIQAIGAGGNGGSGVTGSLGPFVLPARLNTFAGMGGFPETDIPKKPLLRMPPEAGELIGHRAWKVEGGNLLRSYSAGTAWFPGQIMDHIIGSEGVEIDDYTTAGVWAFKDPYELAHQFYGEITSPFAVFGTVWLWGTVIEHERGYRAQYAAIRSLDHGHQSLDLDVLRRTYGIKKIAA